MRKLILTSVMVLALPAIMVAQRNDIYSSGVKSTVSAPVVTAAPAVQSTVTSSPVVSSSFAERDPDEYNRRYNYASSAAAIDNSFANDVIYVHDTVFVESSLSDRKAYKEGYLDAAEDYEFAMRMLRFHSSSRLLNPRYRWTAVADIFWDPWYDPLYSPAWSYAYLDPWYYDSWYYDPWYYDPWYYDPWYYDSWYPHYHGYWPGHSHTIIIAGNVGRPTDRFVPNRQLNNRWDRQLAGGSGRVVRGAADRDPVRQAVSSRTTSSSTVGRTSTGASRNVRVTAPSSSRTSTTVRQNATTNRTQTSAERTTSVVNRSTSGTQRSAGVSSSSVRSSATVNRTTQAGTTYNRPSSTSRQSTNTTVRSEASSSSSRQSTGSTLRSSSSSSSSRQSAGSTLRSSSSTPSRQPANTISRNSENASRSSSRGLGASTSSFSSSSSSISSSSGGFSSGSSSSSSSARSSATSRR